MNARPRDDVRDYRVIRTEDLQRVWHPFFLSDVVAQARTERAKRIGADNWDTLTDAQKLNAYMGVLMRPERNNPDVLDA